MLFRNIFVLFTIVALAEVLLFIKIGEWIGLFWTVVGVFATAAIGVSLLRIQGFDTLRRLQERTAQGQLPAVELVEGVMLLIAGALLLTPGFLTDGIGFLFLIKPSRRLIAGALVKSSLAQGVNWTVSSFGTRTQWSNNPFENPRQDNPRQAEPESDPFTKPGAPHRDHKPEVIDGEFERKE